MSEKVSVKTHYSRAGSYLENDRGQVPISSKAGGFYPYDFLLGALSACFHATLLSIMKKQRKETPVMDIFVSGEKRESTPETLKWVDMRIRAVGVEESERVRFEKAVDMAAKHCSIHETLAQVAEMTHQVEYVASVEELAEA